MSTDDAAKTAPPNPPPATAQEVLDFWYGPLDRRFDPSYEHRTELWFGRGADGAIRDRFADAIRDVGGSPRLREEWCSTPRGAIAYIVLLDQLNRNLRRGTPRMFEHDEKCREEARRLVAERRHLDGSLSPPELVHVAVCLSHSESMSDQELNVLKLLPELLEVVPKEQVPAFQHHAKMSNLHTDEIRKFGRFPHRNPLLGRDSTPQEKEWLERTQYGYHQQVKK